MSTKKSNWFLIGSLGLSTLFAYSGGFAVSSMVKRQVQTENVAPSIETTVTTPQKPVRKRTKTINQNQYVSTIVGRSMFDSSQAGKTGTSTTQPADGDSVESSLQLTLLFTITATPEEFSIALIQNEDAGFASTYGVGYDLLGQATITKIEANRVYFQRHDSQQLEYIEVGTKAEPSKGTDTKRSAKAATDDGDVQKVGNNKYVVDQAVLDEILANPEKLYTQVRVTPHKDSNGDIDGYRMTGIRRKSLFYKLGVKNGDIVHSVNGQPLTSLSAAMDAYNSLGNSRAFSFDITRRKNKQTFDYEVR